MSSLSSRPTRSRVSNHSISGNKPNTRTGSESKASSSGSNQTLYNWVEPIVPPQRPSYADAGIERHGVVQNMAPLGSRPSSKALKAAAILEETGILGRPIGLRKTECSNFSLPFGSIMVAETSGSLSSNTLGPSPKAQRDKTSSLQSIEETSLTLHNSQDQKNRSKSPSVSTAVSRSLAYSIPEVKQVNSAVDINTSDPETFIRESSQSPVVPPATGKDGLPLINLAQTDRVVELAVQNAVDRKRWPTAYALRTLYDDNRGDISFVRLLEAVYYKYATEKDLDEFERLLKPKKCEGRKDRTGEYYFNSNGSDFAARRPIFSAIEALNPPAPAYVTPYNSIPTHDSKPTFMECSKSRSKSPTFMDSSIAQSASLDLKRVHKKPRTNSYPENICIESNNTVISSTGVKSPLQMSEGEFKSKSRSLSVSSSSSLSSVDMNLISEVSVSPKRPVSNHGLARLGIFGARPVFISPYASANNFKEAASSADSEARSKGKPFTVASKPGPKIHTFTVAPSTSTKTTVPKAKLSSSTPFSVTAPPDLNDDTKTTEALPTNSKKRNSKVDTTTPYDVNDERSTKRRKAKEFTNISTIAKVTESFERMSSQFPEAVKEKDTVSVNEEPVTFSTLTPIKRQQKVRLSHKLRQKTGYDSEESSPTELGFRPDLAPNSIPSSRAGTPSNTLRQVKKNKSGLGLRVKSSPMKKKSGTSAGVPKTSNEGNSPIRHSASGNNDENDDFCASCGGNGEVLCCDGDTCKRSFHFKCVDPPIMPDMLPDTWFCNECRVKNSGPQEEKHGIFGLLLIQLEKKNSSAFSLPPDIRGYFEGVKTGPDGEYEEIIVTKPRVTNRAGWEEAPDYFRKRDNKGKPILCHSCGLQAEAPDRVIIPCSYCSLYWHLDCVDMPLAKEPAPGRLWQCQAHVDDLLRRIPNSLAPAHRFRKIKGAPFIQPGFSLGLKNHGHIEIENDPTDDEAESYPVFYEERPFGRIVKITEQSIKLDFLLKVKRDGGGYTPTRFSDAHKKRRRSWSEANLSDQQAALNLSALANSDPDVMSLNNLISTLLSEAPPNVIKMIAQGDAENLASDKAQLRSSDKKSLIALKMLISKKLNCLDEYESEESTRKKRHPQLNDASILK